MTDRPVNPDLPWPGAVQPPPMPNVADAPLGRMGPSVAPDDPPIAEFTRPREMAAGHPPPEEPSGDDAEPARPPDQVPQVGRPIGELAVTAGRDPADITGTDPVRPAENPEIPEVRPQDVVNFHDIGCEHSPENAHNIANALRASGCTAAVFELTGGTAEQRALAEAAMNKLLDPAITPEERADLHSTIEQHAVGYISQVLRYAPPTLERVRVMDIGVEHPSHPDTLAARRTDIAVREGIDNLAPNAEIRESLVQDIERMAHNVPDREAAMHADLMAIAADEARIDPTPHGVAIVRGVGHEAIPQGVAEQGFTCTIADTVWNPDPYVNRPEVTNTLIRQLLDQPGSPLAPMQVDRALLERTVMRHGFVTAQATALATLLPDARITDVLGRLDAIKQTEAPLDERVSRIEQTILEATRWLATDRAIQERLRREGEE